MELVAPLALLTLLVPLAVLVLALAPRRPRREATGTLEIWRRAVQGAPTGGSSRRWRPPAWIVVAAAGLVAWSFSLAAPRLEARDAETYVVLVDRRPRMLLELEDGRSRLDAALTAVVELLGERGDARVSWRTPGADAFETRVSDGAPFARLAALPPADRAPDFEAFDERGVVWVTCTAGTLAPLRAGLVTSGGTAVRGFVGVGPDGWTFWDGSGFEVREAPADPGVVALGEGLPELVDAFVRAYAVARGLGVAPMGARSPRLEVTASARGPALREGARVVAGTRPVAVVRGGFALPRGAVGRVVLEAVDGDGTRAALAVADSGRVLVAPCELGELAPEDVALGLGGVFDEALAPDARLVPVAGRRSQGEPVVRAGEPPEPLPSPFPLRAPLAVVAALAFALAAWLRGR
ncbi:MAG: hypothetical protein R3F34_00360 [Planctomycetota bacterium]